MKRVLFALSQPCCTTPSEKSKWSQQFMANGKSNHLDNSIQARSNSGFRSGTISLLTKLLCYWRGPHTMARSPSGKYTVIDPRTANTDHAVLAERRGSAY